MMPGKYWDANYESLKGFVERYLSGENCGPEPKYMQAREDHIASFARSNPLVMQAYEELLFERLLENNPHGLSGLLGVARRLINKKTGGNEISSDVQEWAFPHDLSNEFLNVHQYKTPLVARMVGVEVVDLLDVAYPGLPEFYAQLMDATPSVDVYSACLKPLLERDRDLFEAAYERNQPRIGTKHTKARRTQHLNELAKSNRQ